MKYVMLIFLILPVLPLSAMTPDQQDALLEKVRESRLHDREMIHKQIRKLHQQYRLRHPRPRQLNPHQRRLLKQRYLRYLRQQRPSR